MSDGRRGGAVRSFFFVRASALVPGECLKLRVNARRDYRAA